MSNDWWTSSSTFHTPQRPSLPQSHSHSHSHAHGQAASRTRFAGASGADELDPEDAQMADNIKFLPSFASSPAGKLALGTSPQNANGPLGGMGSVTSPGEGRRSPTVGTRFGGGQDRDSPRHSRRSLLHNPSFGTANGQHSGSYANATGMGTGMGSGMDEDMPPTTSLRDDVAANVPQGGANVGAAVELPTPQSLIPSSTTTSLHIFGPPVDVLATLKPYLSQFGPVTSYRPGPEGSNWYVVDFASPLAASYALRRHGDIINGRWMVAFKVNTEGSTAGCTLVPGHSSGAGTPLKIQSSGSIIKPKNTAQPVIKSAIPANNDGYGWDEPENQGGWGHWVSERLFGR